MKRDIFDMGTSRQIAFEDGQCDSGIGVTQRKRTAGKRGVREKTERPQLQHVERLENAR